MKNQSISKLLVLIIILNEFIYVNIQLILYKFYLQRFFIYIKDCVSYSFLILQLFCTLFGDTYIYLLK